MHGGKDPEDDQGVHQVSDKIRADVALVNGGFFSSRERAQAAIMAGEVFLGERKINKPSESVSPADQLSVRGQGNPYVSRGALKLEKAVRVFQANLQDRVVMDVGASTGGFTDICLREGARLVYAIDVGYGQLDWKLRNHERVRVMERTNARYLDREAFDPVPTVAVMDVSFISIRLILPALFHILGTEGIIYSLIKPQFEAGRNQVGKKGVVRDPETHLQVLQQIISFVHDAGWKVSMLDYSPITGPEGNIEFLSFIVPSPDPSDRIPEDDIRALISAAHQELHR